MDEMLTCACVFQKGPPIWGLTGAPLPVVGMSSVGPDLPIWGIVRSSLRNFAQRLSLQRKTPELAEHALSSTNFLPTVRSSAVASTVKIPGVKCCCSIPTDATSEGEGVRGHAGEAREGEDAGQMKHSLTSRDTGRVSSVIHSTHDLQPVKSHKHPTANNQIPVLVDHKRKEKLSSDLRLTVRQVRLTRLCLLTHHLLDSCILPSVPSRPFWAHRFPNDRVLHRHW